MFQASKGKCENDRDGGRGGRTPMTIIMREVWLVIVVYGGQYIVCLNNVVLIHISRDCASACTILCSRNNGKWNSNIINFTI